MTDELQLIRLVLAGDKQAWDIFAEEYAPFIIKTIARYARDDEIRHDLFASLLSKLKSGKLSGFTGRSTLRTWLFIVARNHCRDYYRSSDGVRHITKAVSELSRTDRRIFELFYIQSMPVHEVFEALRTELGKSVSYIDILDAMKRIEAEVKRKRLGRILDRLLRTDRRSALPSREEALRYPDLELFFESSIPSPDSLISGKKLGQLLESLKKALSMLPPGDRLMLRMKFERRESARKIGELLGYTSEKQVYRKLEKMYGVLEDSLLRDGHTRDECRQLIGDMNVLYSWAELWELPDQAH